MPATRRLIPIKRDGRPVHVSSMGTSRVEGKLGRCSACGRHVALVQSAKTGRWYMAGVQESGTHNPRVLPWVLHECKGEEVTEHTEYLAAVEATHADKPVDADPDRRTLATAFGVLDNEESGPNAQAWAEATIKATGMSKRDAHRLATGQNYR